jgi:ABC-type bacteriocin/lantibiotic exporters, contain an N-terminal double-glycine peptidase domain
MITRYYGGNVSLDKISELCHTTKSGTSAYNLIKAAEEIGFKATGYKCRLEELVKTKELPIIIHSETNGLMHYMVLYGINEKKEELVIANPSDKLKKINFSDFEKEFTGICIKIYPYKIIPYENKNTIFNNIINFTVKKYKLELIKYIILSLFLIIINLFCSFYLKYIIDIAGSQKSLSLLNTIFYLFILFNFARALISFVSSIILSYFKQKFGFLLTSELYNFILELPYSYFYRNTKGEIIHKFHELTFLKDYIINLLSFLFIDFVPFLISLMILIIMYPKYLYIFLIHNIFFVIIMVFFYPKLFKQINKSKEKESRFYNFINESITGYKMIKGLGIKKNIKKKFDELFYFNISESIKLENIIYLLTSIMLFIENIMVLLLLYLIAIDIIKNNLEISRLIIVNSLLLYYFTPYKSFINIKIVMDRSRHTILKLTNMINTKKESGFIEEKVDGSIFIKNLSFSYDNFKNVLENVYLKVEKGTNVMFVGKSGSGKSTILKLIKRYYHIKPGNIKIDTFDINEYKDSSIEQGIGYIGPNESLFTDTLYNNIALYKKIDGKKLSKIIEICEIDKITSKNNLGLNMFIYEDGFNISEGEKQRIILARFLLHNFNILFIDEAMNAIDINSERKILKGIFNYFRIETIIYVSHRTENLDLFDKLVKFDKGKKVLDIIRNEDGKYRQESIFN